MANNQSSQPQKRPTVTRRERAAALEQARQQQMARDQRRTTIIGAVVVIVLVAAVLIGVSVWRAQHPQSAPSVSVEQAKASVEKVKTKPTNVDGNWGYLISKDGINKPIKHVPTVTMYMDFM